MFWFASRVCRLALWMCLLGGSIVLCGCCARRAARVQPIRDRFSTYVLVGIGRPPCCVLPPNQRLLYNSKRGSQVSIWIRAIFYDHIRTPAPGVGIRFEVVDAFGDSVTGVSLEPRSVVTGKDGFAIDSIRFLSNQIGTFRIRASYPDKNTVSVSLSPTIVIVE